MAYPTVMRMMEVNSTADQALPFNIPVILVKGKSPPRMYAAISQTHIGICSPPLLSIYRAD